MAGQVRFGQSDETGHAAFTGKFVPDRADRLQPEVRNDAFEKSTQKHLVAQEAWVAAGRLDQPFGSNSHRLKILNTKRMVTAKSFWNDPAPCAILKLQLNSVKYVEQNYS